MADKKIKKSTSKAPRESVKSLKEKITALENDLLRQFEETQRIADEERPLGGRLGGFSEGFQPGEGQGDTRGFEKGAAVQGGRVHC